MRFLTGEEMVQITDIRGSRIRLTRGYNRSPLHAHEPRQWGVVASPRMNDDLGIDTAEFGYEVRLPKLSRTVRWVWIRRQESFLLGVGFILCPVAP